MGERDRTDVEKVRAWLDEVILVKLKDGRCVEGHLECFDKLGNVILGDAIEVRDINGNERRRCGLGLVLAPGNAVVSICVRKSQKGVDTAQV